jgi:hypothetical protein
MAPSISTNTQSTKARADELLAAARELQQMEGRYQVLADKLDVDVAHARGIWLASKNKASRIAGSAFDAFYMKHNPKELGKDDYKEYKTHSLAVRPVIGILADFQRNYGAYPPTTTRADDGTDVGI